LFTGEPAILAAVSVKLPPRQIDATFEVASIASGTVTVIVTGVLALSQFVVGLTTDTYKVVVVPIVEVYVVEVLD